MRLLRVAALPLVLVFSACGGDGGGSGSDTLTVEGQAPAADTAGLAAFRDEPLKPSTLKDPRIEQLSDAERRVIRDYVNRGIRRDSLEGPGSPRSLGGWLDSNLTVGEVIALYHGTDKIEPLPPQPLPESPAEAPETDLGSE